MTALLPDSRVHVAGFDIDQLTEAQTVDQVLAALDRKRGGWIVTLNLDICRSAKLDAELAELVAEASLAVPDGMPVIWAARAQGIPLPERVTGASLIDTLSAAAARSSRSVYLLGGPKGAAEVAASTLAERYQGLVVAGWDTPAFGFEEDPVQLAEVRARLLEARPDIVFVGLGFPKQERLIKFLAPELPSSWFVACGAAISFTSGLLPRAPEWMQSSGLEWLHRLGTEPRRLFSRYLVHDLPFAAVLLGGALLTRLVDGSKAATQDVVFGSERPADASSRRRLARQSPVSRASRLARRRATPTQTESRQEAA